MISSRGGHFVVGQSQTEEEAEEMEEGEEDYIQKKRKGRGVRMPKITPFLSWPIKFGILMAEKRKREGERSEKGVRPQEGEWQRLDYPYNAIARSICSAQSGKTHFN